MSTTQLPDGVSIFSDERLELGEGPSYDPIDDTVWWFDILGKALHGKSLSTGAKIVQDLPFKASVIAAIDAERQLIVSEAGLFIRSRGNGVLTAHVMLEPKDSGNRSNDGRAHQSGALWIGTMGLTAETGAGAIYHVAGTRVTRLFERVSIPNSICFSPDGSVGYYVDTSENILMHVTVDPATGLPTGKAQPLIEGADEPGGFDGSICDADGHIWNARWGGARIDRYESSGKLVGRYSLPVKQVTCPAVIGKAADRIIVTTAREGMDEAALKDEPLAGTTFEVAAPIRGRHEPAFKL